MNKKIDLSIVIVTYKSKDILRKCLNSIIHFTKKLTYQIYIVDNDSRDDTSKLVKNEFPKIKLITNPNNIYATRGNNQVLKKVHSRYCLIINPDVELTSNAVYTMFLFLEKHPFIAATTCRQILPTGNTDIVCSRFFTPLYELIANCLLFKFLPFRYKIIGWFRYFNWGRKNNRQVESISDIILLIKTNVLKHVGFYDENIKLFFMEDDLSVKINQAGYQNWYLGKVSVHHIKGVSTNLFTPKSMYQIYEHDMQYYYKKHFGILWWFILRSCFLVNKIYYSVNSFQNRGN